MVLWSLYSLEASLVVVVWYDSMQLPYFDFSRYPRNAHDRYIRLDEVLSRIQNG